MVIVFFTTFVGTIASNSGIRCKEDEYALNFPLFPLSEMKPHYIQDGLRTSHVSDEVAEPRRL
jgi:hypothetical protein